MCTQNSWDDVDAYHSPGTDVFGNIQHVARISLLVMMGIRPRVRPGVYTDGSRMYRYHWSGVRRELGWRSARLLSVTPTSYEGLRLAMLGSTSRTGLAPDNFFTGVPIVFLGHALLFLSSMLGQIDLAWNLGGS